MYRNYLLSLAGALLVFGLTVQKDVVQALLRICWPVATMGIFAREGYLYGPYIEISRRYGKVLRNDHIELFVSPKP